ncbi:hypothetical protein COU16_00095 [Candidatus Kaiserbacteria bacterium CG10_big_fil_rev_8_21_14_0_10_47_16]|uniref:Glycosyltransferase 2-like domain-containing protein n=1 Tax=Candidatus Kaiserbacteria bacterium CG10_big_fil_rev_8_21_14_0_10_47_16 TaxID=1974608 RepID=A0A2H0UET9_9BACT|nr:MAG: hypothetical protein COU16_00095 [Candidatus Kaiserbacteria bacterium CG10_big_fil_rev_8_21_14_0_10_47_16]
MDKIPCSVGILTFNSEVTLRRALESVKNVDDIIICDGGSTDGTLAIAKEYGAHVIAQNDACKNPDGSLRDFACAKNQLIDEAKHPYLLILDSDEATSTELLRELARIAKDGTEDGYRIPIRMWWQGQMIEHAANYPGYQYRIVRTDRDVRMIKPVHERPLFQKPLDKEKTTLSTPWYVYLEDDFVHNYMSRNRKYIKRELEKIGEISFSNFLFQVIPSNVRPMLGIFLRTVWYRLRYRNGVHMPLSVEWGRVRYHLALIRGLRKQICRR